MVGGCREKGGTWEALLVAVRKQGSWSGGSGESGACVGQAEETVELLSRGGVRLSSQKVILTKFTFTFCLVLLQHLSNTCQHLLNIQVSYVWTRALFNKEVGLL